MPLLPMEMAVYLVSSRRRALRSAILAENWLRYAIMPSSVRNSLLFVGVFRFRMASNFSDVTVAAGF